MQIYQVGGSVRDNILGLPSSDKDYVVVGTTFKHMLNLGFKPVGKHFPVFLHPKTGQEYALARTERKNGTGYTGFAFYAEPNVTLEQDLKRRDLTINAIAMDENGSLIDPFNGLTDIQHKILRHVSDAFIEDPLRVLRVARFAARFAHLGFIIADETLNLMKQIVQNNELLTLSVERIWQEFALSLMTKDPQVFISVLENCNALQLLIPELIELEITKNILTKLAQDNTSLDMRLTGLIITLNEGQINDLCKRYKIPNNCSDLAKITNKLKLRIDNLKKFKPLTAHLLKTSDLILNILQTSDYYRRPNRLLNALQILELSSFIDLSMQNLLIECAKQTAQINSKNLSSDITGKNIGVELNKLRLKRITNVIAGFSY